MGARPRVPIEDIWSSYQELGTLRAVAERYGYAGHPAIWRRLRAAGYPMQPKNLTLDSRNVVPIEEVIEIFQRTKTIRETARLVSSTPHAVRDRLVRAGVWKESKR
jgi:hypothetical protein